MVCIDSEVGSDKIRPELLQGVNDSVGLFLNSSPLSLRLIQLGRDVLDGPLNSVLIFLAQDGTYGIVTGISVQDVRLVEIRVGHDAIRNQLVLECLKRLFLGRSPFPINTLSDKVMKGFCNLRKVRHQLSVIGGHSQKAPQLGYIFWIWLP